MKLQISHTNWHHSSSDPPMWWYLSSLPYTWLLRATGYPYLSFSHQAPCSRDVTSLQLLRLGLSNSLTTFVKSCTSNLWGKNFMVTPLQLLVGLHTAVCPLGTEATCLVPSLCHNLIKIRLEQLLHFLRRIAPFLGLSAGLWSQHMTDRMRF